MRYIVGEGIVIRGTIIRREKLKIKLNKVSLFSWLNKLNKQTDPK